jgi:hypothetical protein
VVFIDINEYSNINVTSDPDVANIHVPSPVEPTKETLNHLVPLDIRYLPCQSPHRTNVDYPFSASFAETSTESDNQDLPPAFFLLNSAHLSITINDVVVRPNRAAGPLPSYAEGRVGSIRFVWLSDVDALNWQGRKEVEPIGKNGRFDYVNLAEHSLYKINEERFGWNNVPGVVDRYSAYQMCKLLFHIIMFYSTPEEQEI